MGDWVQTEDRVQTTVPDGMPTDLSLGELYRILLRVEVRIDSLISDVQNNKLSVDVYNAKHSQLEEDVKDVKNEVRDIAERRSLYRSQLALVAIGAAFSLLVAISAVVTSVLLHA